LQAHKPPVFLNLIDEVMTSEREVRAVKYKDYAYRHNPSSASFKKQDGTVIGSCMRQLWYKATKVKESNATDSASFLKMGFGDAIHDWFMRKLQKSKKITLLPEVGGRVLMDPLTREISFRVDGLATHRSELGGFELKTTQGMALSWMKKAGKGPKEDHLLQILSYFGTNEAIQWYSLVYVARDSAFKMEFHITKEDDGYYFQSVFPNGPKTKIPELSFQGIVSRWVTLESYVKSEIMPPRDYKIVFNDSGEIVPNRVKKGVRYRSDWRCLYCSFKDLCWSQPDAKKEAYSVNGGLWNG